jgi:Cu(I)/Ag(I) efflux system membrane fusion protein
VLPLVVLIVGIALGISYRDALGTWFGWGTADRAGHEHAENVASPSAPPPAAQPKALQLPPHAFAEPALLRLREGFAVYESIRSLLAHDQIEGVAAYSDALKQALEAAKQGDQGQPDEFAAAFDRTRQVLDRLQGARDVATARAAFGELSEVLVALAASDPRLEEGLHIFLCPMAKGYQKWFQPATELENPYMGQAMLTCGVASEWSAKEAKVDSPSSGGGGEIAYYTCPMHPSVRQQTPGPCPICGMDLAPVTKQEAESGTLIIDEARRQRIGVRTTKVGKERLTHEIRAVGEVRVDETSLSDVNLRMSGWVQKLSVNKTGQWVKRGQTLFTLYSPELYAAQLEYLTAVRRQGEATSDTFAALTRSARQRLRLLGMSEAQIDEVHAHGEASDQVPVAAPASGHVIEKRVVDGARVEAGMLVYRIADLSRIWIDAEVYEADLPHVKRGQPVEVELPYVPDASYDGKVDFVYPTLDGPTRTGRVRIVLQNSGLELKPDMYANVLLDVDLGERLTVPEQAVVYTGPRRLVFVDLGEGKLKPKVVELGVHVDGRYEVKSGLSEGDVVVTSGNFLIAAESRIRSAAEYWESSNDSHQH